MCGGCEEHSLESPRSAKNLIERIMTDPPTGGWIDEIGSRSPCSCAHFLPTYDQKPPAALPRTVIATKGGWVEGDVEAREVVLDGEVHGSVDARERLEIQASAVVRGDLHAPRLMVHEGAVVDSDVSMAGSGTESQRGAA